MKYCTGEGSSFETILYKKTFITIATIDIAKNIKNPYAAALLVAWTLESSALDNTMIGIKNPPNPPIPPDNPP